MTVIRIVNHDGSIRICRPQTDLTKTNRFGGDFKKLAETVCRKAHPSTHEHEMPNFRLYKSVSVS